jgi:hypothetical protein
MYAASAKASSAVIALALLSTFLPVVRGRYAFSDDYPLLFIFSRGGSSSWFGNVEKYYVTAGRPISAFVYDVVYSTAGTIDNLRFVRFLGVAGIMALGIVLHSALVRSGVRTIVAALFALVICTLPPFQVIASWAVLFVSPYAALLSGGASFLIENAVRARHRLALRLLSASGLLLAALLVYQPAAMFFWVFLAIALIGSRHDVARARSLVGFHLFVGGAAVAIAFCSTKAAMHFLGAAAPNAGRSAVTHDPIGKVRWFLGDPLYQSLNLFHLTLVPWLAALVTAIAFGGGVLLLRTEGVSPFILGIALLLIPLSFLPGLLVAENSSTYRIEVALASLIGLYTCLGAVGLWLTARKWLESRRRLRTAASVERLVLAATFVLVAACAANASHNVQVYVVHPQQVELAMLRREVAALPDRVIRVAYARPRRGLTSRYFSDELGVPSSVRPWSPRPAVLLVLAEQRRLAHNGGPPIVDVLPANAQLPRDEPVVDLRALPKQR